MALWPFRRKSRRRWGRASTFADVEDARGRKPEQSLPPRSQTVPDATAEPNVATGSWSKRRNGTGPNKLQRRARTYSFSPGRNDSIRVGRKRSARGKQKIDPPVPSLPGINVAGSSDPGKGDAAGGNEGHGWRTLGEDVFARVPTLHNKRDSEHLMPRKLSSKKRRKNEHDREAEIKAMSNFMPLRPAADDWTAGRPMKKDSKRAKKGLGLSFGGAAKQEWHRLNRSSDISLPTAESIHSSLSTDSEYVSYKVSALEALVPRPTLRYAVYPRWGPPAGESGSGPMRVPSQRRKLSERVPIPEATLRAHKRVDDLADDLSAGDLRELMERDQRRRERKRQRDQERMERRLATRAEKQRANESTTGEAPPNLERGVLGREATGLGINPPSAVVTSSRQRPPKQWSTQPDLTTGDEMDQDSQHQPLDAFHRTTSMPLETPLSPPQLGEPVPPVTQSSKARRFLRSKMSRSKSPPATEDKVEASVNSRKRSGSGGSKGPLSWSSIFRWANRNKRSSQGPSSFSNTSRDSMQTNQLPTPAPNSTNSVTYAPHLTLSRGVPKRTTSRFREDLPELPMSPPASRRQSPEADPIPMTIMEASPAVESQSENTAYASLPATQKTRHVTSRSSGYRSIEGTGQTPSTTSRPDEADPSPEPQSMSLASIDSEGSWLSGRLGARRRSSGNPEAISIRVQHPQQEEGSSNNNSPSYEHDTAGEDISIVDDEYLSRFARSSHERSGWNRKSTGEARPSSDEGEDARWGAIDEDQSTVVREDARWGAVNELVPTVIHPANRMKSREVILKDSEVGDLAGDGNDPEEEGSRLHRATSINLGKDHARSFSAGSAKLLQLSPRSSVDDRRTNAEPKS
ncbi:hypothetical protein QBC33DRAFT_158690 [Phialemonium atrogriseum]|uniref:Uncharacterized protein n=1 Tax=Phialemonium atrogriseum TaxID=1093897 RepID=A0AAJ0CAG5_9PEZI|nr:uncharacterized protein QBC33DRAFT_158690 [Phialemonium atrogriseum]KAK1771619.1 hypothetical protein QBC33DRAFT_158690 [Phialemonium atrogriseum]